MRRTVLAAILFCTPLSVVWAQNTTWLKSVVTGGNTILTQAVPALVTVALMVYVMSAVVLVARAQNDEARKTGRKRMLWGIIGIFVMVSVWGFVAILQDVFGIGSSTVPSRPSTGIAD